MKNKIEEKFQKNGQSVDITLYQQSQRGHCLELSVRALADMQLGNVLSHRCSSGPR